MHRSFLFSSVALLWAFAPGLAAAAPETVVVTATRTPQPLEVTGASMSVVHHPGHRHATDRHCQRRAGADAGADRSGNGAWASRPTFWMSRRGRRADTGAGGRCADQRSQLDHRLCDPRRRAGKRRRPHRSAYAGRNRRFTARRHRRRRQHPHQARRQPAVTLHLRAEAVRSTPIISMWRQTAPAAPWNMAQAANYYGTNGISAADSKNGNSEPTAITIWAHRNLRCMSLTPSVSTRASITQERATASTAIRRPLTPSRIRTNMERRASGGLWRRQYFAVGRAVFQSLGGAAHDSDRKEFDPTLTPAEDFFAKVVRRGSNIKACSRRTTSTKSCSARKPRREPFRRTTFTI